MAARRQTLEVTLPDNLPLITGDKPRLTQVFVNLLANANKFAPEGSVVRIGAEATDTRVQCWVEDEGPGPAESETGGLPEDQQSSLQSPVWYDGFDDNMVNPQMWTLNLGGTGPSLAETNQRL